MASIVSERAGRAAGLPAVGFRTPWRDLIDEVGHGELAPLHDIAAFAAAAARILRLPDQGRSLGALARDYSRRNLSVRSSVASWPQAMPNMGVSARTFTLSAMWPSK